MIKKIIITIMLTGLLAPVCFAGRVNVKRLDKANWIHFESDNFNVLTDAEEEKALELVDELEDFRYFLSIILRYKQEPLSPKVSIVASKDIRTFKSTGIPGVYSGIFTKGYGYTIIAQCDGFTSSLNGKNNCSPTSSITIPGNRRDFSLIERCGLSGEIIQGILTRDDSGSLDGLELMPYFALLAVKEMFTLHILSRSKRS